MSSSQGYKISWDQHKASFSKTLQTLQQHSSDTYQIEQIGEHLFQNVTIVSDDNIKFKVNKLLLGACSPFIKSLMEEISSPDHFIHLTGINHRDLRPILDFIHLGKTKIDRSKKNEFLNIAVVLDIKAAIENFKHLTKSKSKKQSGDEVDSKIGVVSTSRNLKRQNLRENVKSTNSSIKERKSELFDTNATSNVPYEHGPKLQYAASDKESLNTSQNLENNTNKDHKEPEFFCDKCFFQAFEQGVLNKHIENEHDGEGLQYFCKKCKFVAQTENKLRSHHKIEHEGRNYTCVRCNFTTRWRSNYVHHNKTH